MINRNSGKKEAIFAGTMGSLNGGDSGLGSQWIPLGMLDHVIRQIDVQSGQR